MIGSSENRYFIVEFSLLLLSVENSPSNCDRFWGEGQNHQDQGKRNDQQA